jgi:outer membrane protein OmpA-like peptidoglycan-associated protein
LIPALGAAQGESKTYSDSRGRKIVFHQGDISFADKLVSFDVGKPAPPDKRWADPRKVLGTPDYDPRNSDPAKAASVALGCAGSLVVRFTDNVLVDVPGPDLYVFEVGPRIEGMLLAISPDGMTWTDAGKIVGGTAEVDIAKAAKPDETYRFVRVTDLKSGCSGAYPGADVDAIGAIGSAFQISLDSSVLFEFNKSELRPQAQATLDAAAAKIQEMKGRAITVDGHTDNVGGDDYNLKLSRARADSVRTYLLSKPALKGRVMTSRGYGARRPVAPNDTDEGRQQNRRVEIVVAPTPEGAPK